MTSDKPGGCPEKSSSLLHRYFQVDLDKVESALRAIWRQTAERDFAEDSERAKSLQSSPRVRAIFSNIIFLCSSEKTGVEHDVDELIGELCIAHPSRFFVVEFSAEKNYSDANKSVLPIETFVSSRCALAHSGAHVCSEEVYIRTSREGFAGIPSLLLGLLVADVSAVMVLNCDPFFPCGSKGRRSCEDGSGVMELFSLLWPICDRVIYDSRQFSKYLSNGPRFIEHVGSLCKRAREEDGIVGASGCAGSLENSGHGNLGVRDLSWVRLKGFCDSVAGLFELPREQGAVRRIVRVVIVCSQLSDEFVELPSDACLLGAWILSRLGFTPTTVRKISGEPRGFEVLSRNLSGSEELKVIFCSRGDSIDNSFSACVDEVIFDFAADTRVPSARVARGEALSKLDISLARILVSEIRASGDGDELAIISTMVHKLGELMA
ncbi:MAG: glucose-6-phosphate dehydrogenase assembly protein OpcA [Deltaproteobacteria bacterium]|nr:glucose-6-phosphate dehydrogenase assembly protein OpcA [Deltaproteobacteria bacterium]